ncbi:MAG: pyrroline-5-carboxylate reductase [Burkholderiales bacterium]|nr:pyrroline-5-carboxylate reductase [Burkholderiales bacterium]
MNVTFVGGGNMADALVGGLLAKGVAPAALRVVDIDAAARARLQAKYAGVLTYAETRAALREGDVVLFAVKPQQLREAARAAALGRDRHLVVSIAAGVRIASLARWLGGYGRIVRAMPNTPALVGAGVTALCAAPGCAEADLAAAETILGAVGRTVRIGEERLMDAVTAVSGSGPAYVFWLIEQLAAAGEALGLAAETARTLALETVLGAAKLAAQSGEPPELLRARVTSKGGTTEAALAVFDQERLGERFFAAVRAACARGDELGRALDRD